MERGAAAYRGDSLLFKRSKLFIASLILLTGGSLAIAERAEAAVAGTTHSIPGGVLIRNTTQGVWGICVQQNYACTGGGYNGSGTQTGNDAWYRQFWIAGSTDVNDATKRHNCTTYAGFRQWQNGVPKPAGFSGNASAWATNAANLGIRVDQTPKVAAVAQWNRNHVAYVDDVGIDYIEITADNYVTRTTEHFLIRNGSPYWPDNFIHFKGLPKLADLNGDYRVDVTDLSILESRWGTSDPASDLNQDGTVNIFDLSILLSHWSSNHTFADLAK
jgi:surface antigen